MHPIKPEWDGQNMVGKVKDGDGVDIIAALVSGMRQSPDGRAFVQTNFPRPGETKPVPKLQYNMKVDGWNWMVGSGLYTDDLDAMVWRILAVDGALVLAGLLMIGDIGWLTLRSVMRQIGGEPVLAVSAMRSVAGGDLTVTLPRVPAGSLLAALADVIASLRGTVGQVRWAVRVRLLGAFECEAAALAASAGAKAQAKPMALLRLIALHEPDGGVAAATVAHALWPGEGREGREKALETTLARLRKLLGHADAITLHEQRLRLSPLRVWCDWPALLQRLDRIEAAPLDSVGRGWDEVFTLWRGPLLGEEPGEPAWLQPWRARLRSRLAAALLAGAATPGHAARCLRAFSIDTLLEARMREPA